MKGHEIFSALLKILEPYLGKNSIKEEDVENIKKQLDTIPFFSSLMYKLKLKGFQRVTINKRLFNGEDKRIYDVNLLKYPPEKYVTRYGRANHPSESVLYATFDPITALSELRPNVEDRITISTWELKNNYDLTISPVFKNTTKDGVVHNEISLRSEIEYKKVLRAHDEETARQIDMLIQFMADCFAKEVEDGNHFDYFLSAYFTNKIFNELENGEVEAIIYPSVRQSLTLSNIAIKPKIFDNNYVITKVEESIVEAVPTKDTFGWSLAGTATTNKFDGNKILW